MTNNQTNGISNFSHADEWENNIQIAHNGRVSLALTENGDLYWWGILQRQIVLGMSYTGTEELSPVKLDLPPGVEVKKIYTDGTAFFFIDTNGDLYSYGDNNLGQLGIGNNIYQTTFQKVLIPEGKKVEKITHFGGAGVIIALTTDGELYGWGLNYYGVLGNGSRDLDFNGNPENYTPKRIQTNLEGVKIIAVSGYSYHVFALSDVGELYTWGTLYDNNWVSDYGRETVHNPRKVDVPQNITFKAIYMEGMSEFAITSDGELYGWRYNLMGQVGVNSWAENVNDLVNVSNTSCSGKKFKEVILGGYHTMLIDKEDNIYAMGRNNQSQLAIDSYTYENKNRPTKSNLLSTDTVKQIVLGGDNTFVLNKNGELQYIGELNQSSGLFIYETGVNDLTYVGNFLNPHITNVSALADTTFELEDDDTNVPVDISEINVSFDKAMATGSDRPTDTGIVGNATLIKQGESENLLQTSSSSQMRTASVTQTWSEDAKNLTLSVDGTLEYSTTYELKLEGYEKHYFGGNASDTYTFTTETDPNLPTPTDTEDKPAKPEQPDTAKPNEPGIVDNSSNNSNNGGNGATASSDENATLDSDRQGAFRPFSPRNDGQGGDSTDGTVDQTEATTKAPATITDGQTPLSSGNGTGNWSLLSLLLGITSVIVSLMFMLIRRKKDSDDGIYGHGSVGMNDDSGSNETVATGLLRASSRNDGRGGYSTNGQGRTEWSSEYSENSSHHGIALKLIAVLVGLLPIALFLILDDLTKSMVFVNRYTVLIAIAFVVHMVITVVAKVKQDKNEEETYTI